MSKAVLFPAIQFSISTQFTSIWPIDRTLSRATTPNQSGPGSTLHSPKLKHYWNHTIRLFRKWVLPLCREAVGIFYIFSWLGNIPSLSVCLYFFSAYPHLNTACPSTCLSFTSSLLTCLILISIPLLVAFLVTLSLQHICLSVCPYIFSLFVPIYLYFHLISLTVYSFIFLLPLCFSLSLSFLPLYL